MDRRGFLGTMLAACAAPAIVKAGSIMRIKPILLPNADFAFTSADLRMSVDEFSEKYLQPAMEQMADAIEENITAELLLTPSMIINEALRCLEKNLIWAKSVNADYEQSFRNVGNTITIRRPRRHEQTESPRVPSYRTEHEVPLCQHGEDRQP